MGGKLTKFRGHEGISEKHESFYLRKFLAVRYVGYIPQQNPLKYMVHRDRNIGYNYTILTLLVIITKGLKDYFAYADFMLCQLLQWVT